MDEQWHEDMLKYLAEDIRETKKLVKETRKLAIAAQQTASAAITQANQLRELVLVSRNEWQDFRDYLYKPWWKKFFNIK